MTSVEDFAATHSWALIALPDGRTALITVAVIDGDNARHFAESAMRIAHQENSKETSHG